jgi:hypothetical protein
MLSYLAELASCAKVIPPAFLIAFNPFAPSDPAPDRITPMAFFFLVGGQGLEEMVDRTGWSRAFFSSGKLQNSALYREIAVRRNHVNVIRFYPGLVSDLEDWKLRCAAEQLRQRLRWVGSRCCTRT